MPILPESPAYFRRLRIYLFSFKGFAFQHPFFRIRTQASFYPSCLTRLTPYAILFRMESCVTHQRACVFKRHTPALCNQPPALSRQNRRTLLRNDCDSTARKRCRAGRDFWVSVSLNCSSVFYFQLLIQFFLPCFQ